MYLSCHQFSWPCCLRSLGARWRRALLLSSSARGRCSTSASIQELTEYCHLVSKPAYPFPQLHRRCGVVQSLPLRWWCCMALSCLLSSPARSPPLRRHTPPFCRPLGPHQARLSRYGRFNAIYLDFSFKLLLPFSICDLSDRNYDQCCRYIDSSCCAINSYCYDQCCNSYQSFSMLYMDSS